MIFLNTLPKSGSIYMANTISKALDIPQVRISQSTFPRDIINGRHLIAASSKDCLAQEHIDAYSINLQYIEHFSPKIFVHIRHPAQTLQSLIHHANRYFNELPKESKWKILMTPMPGINALKNQSIEEQRDWYVMNLFPEVVGWINGWLYQYTYNERNINIFLGKYEEFRPDNLSYINKISSFFGKRKILEKELVSKDMKNHFREGSADTYKTFFTSEQLISMDKMMSGLIRDHYKI